MARFYAEINYNNNGSSPITIDYSRLRKAESDIISKENYTKPSFGLMSNKGSISFLDDDSFLDNESCLKAINEGKLDNATVSFYIEIENVKKQVGSYGVRSWNYDEKSKMITGMLQSKSIKGLQNIIYEVSEGQWELIETSLYAIYEKIINSVSGYDFELSATAKNVLESITVETPILQKGKSVWFHLSEIFKISGLSCYEKADGKIFTDEL